jgi:hypothetical protein
VSQLSIAKKNDMIREWHIKEGHVGGVGDGIGY